MSPMYTFIRSAMRQILRLVLARHCRGPGTREGRLVDAARVDIKPLNKSQPIFSPRVQANEDPGGAQIAAAVPPAASSWSRAGVGGQQWAQPRSRVPQPTCQAEASLLRHRLDGARNVGGRLAMDPQTARPSAHSLRKTSAESLLIWRGLRERRASPREKRSGLARASAGSAGRRGGAWTERWAGPGRWTAPLWGRGLGREAGPRGSQAGQGL